MAQTGTVQSGSRSSLAVTWLDSSGKPVLVDGPTTWTSSDTSKATVTAGTGNTKIATLVSLGPTGNVQIQASADADMGDGLKPVTSVMDITIIGGEAESGNIDLKPI